MDRQVKIWKEWTRTAEGHQEDEWCKAQKTWKLVNRYTGHKTAQSFRAHVKDVEMFKLDSVSQKDKVKTEKVLKEHQRVLGGIGANVMGIMVACESLDETLRSVQKFFKEGVYKDGTPINYKKEVSKFIVDLHTSVGEEFTGELMNLVEMSARGFNNALY